VQDEQKLHTLVVAPGRPLQIRLQYLVPGRTLKGPKGITKKPFVKTGGFFNGTVLSQAAQQSISNELAKFLRYDFLTRILQ